MNKKISRKIGHDPVRCFRLPDELWERLDTRAEFNNTTISEEVRDLLNFALYNIDGPLP
jgi:hypothetical protein